MLKRIFSLILISTLALQVCSMVFAENRKAVEETPVEAQSAPEAAAAQDEATTTDEQTPEEGEMKQASEEEEQPIGRLTGLKIGIDPGHQLHANNGKEPVSPGSKSTKAKVSSGTAGVSTRIPEYETNLTISLLLRDALLADGAQVLMTRETNDVDISNVQRAVMMNEWGADLVLRLHCNGSTNRKANGIGLYVRATGQRSQECYNAAEAILPCMVEATGARRDGIFKRDTYSGLNWSEVPAILVEMGYMSNPAEDQKLNDPAYQALLVEGMVNGIADYFERAEPAAIANDEALDALLDADASVGE